MKLKIVIVLCCFFVGKNSISSQEPTLDDQLEIIEKLELPELFNISLASPVGHQKANVVYKWKYGDFPVEISHHKYGIRVWNDKVNVDYNMGETFLKAFGPSIDKLSIAYHFLPYVVNHMEIGRYVNEFCHDTIVEFTAHHAPEGAFNNMTKPFTKVERVAITGQYKKSSTNPLGFDELFPNLQLLNMTYMNGCILEYVFPNLVEFNTGTDSMEELPKFFENNPQIKKLRLDTTSVEVLQTANNYLPELEVFDFQIPKDLPSYTGPTIEFKNIKETEIRDFSNNYRSGNIKFNQLKKLSLKIGKRVDNTWAHFIGSNEQLETLVITFGNFIHSSLLTVASKLNNLVEADIRCDNEVPIETMLKFIESNPKFKKVILSFPENTVFILNTLSEKLATDWKVTPEDKYFKSIIIEKLESVQSSTEPTDQTSVQNSTENNNNKNETSSDNSASYVFSSTVLTVTMLAMMVKQFGL